MSWDKLKEGDKAYLIVPYAFGYQYDFQESSIAKIEIFDGLRRIYFDYVNPGTSEQRHSSILIFEYVDDSDNYPDVLRCPKNLRDNDDYSSILISYNKESLIDCFNEGMKEKNEDIQYKIEALQELQDKMKNKNLLTNYV